MRYVRRKFAAQLFALFLFGYINQQYNRAAGLAVFIVNGVCGYVEVFSVKRQNIVARAPFLNIVKYFSENFAAVEC